MRQVLGYLLDYQRKHFEWKVYLAFIVFMAICIGLNYRWDFEDTYVDQFYRTPLHWVAMFFFHLIPYLGVCLLLFAFGKVENVFLQNGFWLRMVIGFGILALERSFYGFREFIESTTEMKKYGRHLDYTCKSMIYAY